MGTDIISKAVMVGAMYLIDVISSSWSRPLMVVDDWNSLPSEVVEARDVEQFNAKLDEAWEDIRFLHSH